MADKKLVTVRSPFFLGSRLVSVGEVYADDDPVVVGRPKAFVPVEVRTSAEAKPKRTTTRRTTTRSRSASRGTKRTAKKS